MSDRERFALMMKLKEEQKLQASAKRPSQSPTASPRPPPNSVTEAAKLQSKQLSQDDIARIFQTRLTLNNASVLEENDGQPAPEVDDTPEETPPNDTDDMAVDDSGDQMPTGAAAATSPSQTKKSRHPASSPLDGESSGKRTKTSDPSAPPRRIDVGKNFVCSSCRDCREFVRGQGALCRDCGCDLIHHLKDEEEDDEADAHSLHDGSDGDFPTDDDQSDDFEAYDDDDDE